jgi:hypothetical protein
MLSCKGACDPTLLGPQAKTGPHDNDLTRPMFFTPEYIQALISFSLSKEF